MPEELTVNGFAEGKVVRIKPFGAIVALSNGQQGLVHISHVSDKFVQDINDYVNVGDFVKVKVLSVDADSGKIALSIKDAGLTIKEPPVKVPFFSEEFQRPVKELATFEEKMKNWQKTSNELQATLSKRKKRK